MAQDYARKHALELDETLTFHDVGVSAYRGQNADVGMLAYFVEAVHSGLVPQGSMLLVEQLDRISRLTPRKALRVLEDIVDAGVSVVTMNDGREYSKGSLDKDPLDLLVSIMTFMRANEESASKAGRLKASWEAKRANADTVPMTSRIPAWLTLDRDAGKIRAIPSRAAIVQRIFDMTLNGTGQHAIASTFNREGLAPWGRGSHWQRSYVAKILESPAVVGTFVPNVVEYEGPKKTKRTLAPISGYYPKVISDEVFAEVRALQSSGAAVRGRHASRAVTNILAGMAKCSACGRTMTRTNKGKRSQPAFVCTAAKAGAGCAYRSVRYSWIETAVRQRLPEHLGALPAADRDAALDQEINGVEEWLDELRSMGRDLMDPTIQAPMGGRGAALATVETGVRETEKRLKELRAQQEVSSGPLIAARVAALLSALADEHKAPSAINLAMRKVFDSAIIDPDNRVLELEYIHGGACVLGY